MKKRFFQLGILLIVFAFAVCAAAQIAWANPKHQQLKVFVLGDSLSDPGNLYELTGGLLPPSPPYAKSYSNGPVWTEYFAKLLRVKVDSLAYGGAFTGELDEAFNLNTVDYGIPGLPGIPQEVDKLPGVPEDLDPDALYVIWAGANDFFYGLEHDPANLESILAKAVQNIANTICELGKAGATHFAVPNLPDIGKTPFGQSLEEVPPEVLTGAAMGFNQLLANTLNNLVCEYPPKTLVILDVFMFFGDVVDHPKRYGLKNVTDPCLTVFEDGSYKVCRKPNTYLFWDTVHPTTAGHALLAKYFRRELCDCGADHHHWWLNHGYWGKEPPPFWRELCRGAR